MFTLALLLLASLLLANEITRVKRGSDGCFQMDDQPAALVYHHAIKQMTLYDVVDPVIAYSAHMVSVPRFISWLSLPSVFCGLSSASLAAFNLVKGFAFFSHTDFECSWKSSFGNVSAVVSSNAKASLKL